MLARSRTLVTLLIALSIGAQWPLLQSIAWVKMFVDYSAQENISTAFSKTFDGKNKCNICIFVEEGKKAEQQDEKKSGLQKLELALHQNVPFIFQVPELDQFSSFHPSSRLLSYPPLSPPPNLA